MKPVFQSSGIQLGTADYPALSIAAGEAGGWQAGSHEECLRLLDCVTGLRSAPPGSIVWFDRDLASLQEKGVLKMLGRLMPMTPDGGLVSNVITGENILLPFVWRNPDRNEEGTRRLEALLESAPWRDWFPPQRLQDLPHQLPPLGHALAAVLRAWLAQPEAVIACGMLHGLEARDADIMARALAWLREALPQATWLFLQTESTLPGGMSGNILGPKP